MPPSNPPALQPPSPMRAYCEAVWRRFLMAEKEERRLYPERFIGERIEDVPKEQEICE